MYTPGYRFLSLRATASALIKQQVRAPMCDSVREIFWLGFTARSDAKRKRVSCVGHCDGGDNEVYITRGDIRLDRRDSQLEASLKSQELASCKGADDGSPSRFDGVAWRWRLIVVCLALLSVLLVIISSFGQRKVSLQRWLEPGLSGEDTGR